MTPSAGLQRWPDLDPPHTAAALAAEGWAVFVLPDAIAGRETFFDGVRAVLPLDPPLDGVNNWDALADSLWEGIHELAVPRVAVLWPRGEDLLGAPDDLATAQAVLADIAASLAEPRFTQGRPTELAIIIG